MSNSNNGNSNDSESPLSVAREKIQTSAREIMESLQKSIRPSPDKQRSDNGLESAFRMMFSSCTNPSTAAVEDHETPELTETTETSNDTPVLHRSSSAPQRHRESLRNLSYAKLSKQHRQRTPVKHHTTSFEPASQHIYEDLQLFDDQLDYKQSKTENISDRIGITPMTDVAPSSKKPRDVSLKPFPVSTPSPLHTSSNSSTPSHSLGIAVLKTPTFDDDISAISAHTLEAMALEVRSRSADSKPRSRQPSFARSTTPRTDPAKQQDWWKHHRYGTPHSRSTGTTQSSSNKSFELWKTAEQDFWNQEVRVEHRRHPHDTLPTNLEEEGFDVYETGEI